MSSSPSSIKQNIGILTVAIALLLLILTCALPIIKVDIDVSQNGGSIERVRSSISFFEFCVEISGSTSITACATVSSYELPCQAMSHVLKAGAAFAILSVLATSVLLVVMLCRRFIAQKVIDELMSTTKNTSSNDDNDDEKKNEDSSSSSSFRTCIGKYGFAVTFSLALVFSIFTMSLAFAFYGASFCGGMKLSSSSFSEIGGSPICSVLALAFLLGQLFVEFYFTSSSSEKEEEQENNRESSPTEPKG